MRTYHNNPLTVSNTKSLKYICGNFTFEALNLHREKSTLEKIVPQGLIRNTEYGSVFLWKYQFTANCELTLFFLKQNAFKLNNLQCEKGLFVCFCSG